MRILSTVALALASYGTLVAGPILQYTFNGTASGTLNGVAFSSQSLAVTTIADAATVTDVSGDYSLTLGSDGTSFIIGGVTTGLFLDSTYFFDNAGVAGFGDNGASICCDTIQIHDSAIGSTAYATYNLQSPIAAQTPEGSDPSLGDWINLNTNLGSFTVTSLTNVTFTVTAASAAVPEPSTFSLLAASLGALALIARKRL